MITYATSLDGISSDQLTGFFIGWPSHPPPETHLKILQGSSHVVIALDGEQVVGFITAVSDGVLSAYIPLLEVVPEYQGRGIGRELVVRMLDQLGDLYMIDLCCDVSMREFYEKLGMKPVVGMIIRNYEKAAD